MPRRPGVVDSAKYERARELRAAGHSLTTIAKKTGAAYSTVHRWTRDVRPDLARPAEHTEAIRRSRATATAALAVELERGGCGTPGCSDPDCATAYGLCHCGCGEPAPIATMSERKRGFVRGEPHLFILGHNRRGFSPAPLSEEGRQKLSVLMAAKRSDGTISTEHLSRASQRRWKRGTGLEGLAALYGGRARQRWFGRWEGRKYGELGGRPTVELTEEQHAEAVKLHEQGWGRDAIASRLLVSPHAVRKALYS